jgi:hypothetical protein
MDREGLGTLRGITKSEVCQRSGIPNMRSSPNSSPLARRLTLPLQRLGLKPRRTLHGLRNNPLVAKRIEELQARNERKAEAAALKRDELVAILTDIVKAARDRLKDARLSDPLKAAEMLTKICGWNEPEKPQDHQHVHMHVDAALIEQLRAGYATLAQRGEVKPAYRR